MLSKSRVRKHGKLAVWLIVGTTLVIGGLVYDQNPSKADHIVVYKSPNCGCCQEWVNHLKENGFSVEVHDQNDMNPIKIDRGVPRHLQSCHTAELDGYVVEGHVPADLIIRLLQERPQVKGLAVAGMPMGSPGMEGPRKDPYQVLTFQENGRTSVYANR